MNAEESGARAALLVKGLGPQLQGADTFLGPPLLGAAAPSCRHSQGAQLLPYQFSITSTSRELHENMKYTCISCVPIISIDAGLLK